ncbi:MAG: hypothetical protein IJ659_07660, partial [Alloprevotella sp.]|nr:hypothetical protein [Alloprevotella sp.]
PSRLPNFIVEFDPQKKHFLHHINNKCSKGKYLSAFPKISPLKMTNKPENCFSHSFIFLFVFLLCYPFSLARTRTYIYNECEPPRMMEL